MMASLRFKGLDIPAGVPVASFGPSPNLERAWLTGPVISTVKGIAFSRTCFSKLLRSVGLILPPRVFSCPQTSSCDEDGVELPQSEAWLNARLIGLLGDVRVRDEARGAAVLDRLADRSESFTLGGNGLAKGEGVCDGVPLKMVDGCEFRRFGGDRGDGESGDFGDAAGVLSVIRRNLEGERDNERRSDLTAEVTSTW